MSERDDDTLTLVLTLEEREWIMRVLTDEIEHRAADRATFNALVQLRAKMGGIYQRHHDAAWRASTTANADAWPDGPATHGWPAGGLEPELPRPAAAYPRPSAGRHAPDRHAPRLRAGAGVSAAPARAEVPDDDDQDLPAALRPFAAGLRPAAKPEGVAWQQEIIYERVGKNDQQIAAIARHYFKEAQNYDANLSRERITASQYYDGRPFGDGSEQPGRQPDRDDGGQDTIRQTLPSLLRVFTAVEDPVSFEPISSEIQGDDKLATSLARQATDYCRWALFTANKGWQVLHDALLDALTRKAGWVRWYWGARRHVRTEVCEGLLLPQLQLLLAEPGIEAQRIVRRPMTPEEQRSLLKTQEGQMYLQSAPAEYWAATLTRTAQQSWPQVEAVPADCVWIDPGANTVEGARAVFHVRDVTASHLIEMGLPEDKVMAHASAMMMPRAAPRDDRAQHRAGLRHRAPSFPPGDKSMTTGALRRGLDQGGRGQR